jgi:hypothetical protein
MLAVNTSTAYVARHRIPVGPTHVVRQVRLLVLTVGQNRPARFAITCVPIRKREILISRDIFATFSRVAHVSNPPDLGRSLQYDGG